jgi:hypothetical protein
MKSQLVDARDPRLSRSYIYQPFGAYLALFTIQSKNWMLIKSLFKRASKGLSAAIDGRASSGSNGFG